LLVGESIDSVTINLTIGHRSSPQITYAALPGPLRVRASM
jgi:hypothetical protein